MSWNPFSCHRQAMACALMVVLVSGLMPVVAAAVDAKLAPPTTMAQVGAQQVVREAYKDKLAAAKTLDQKKALARQILNEAKDQKVAHRYAMLTTTLELANDVGDFPTALAAIDALDREFDLDALKMKVAAATAAARLVRTTDDKKNFVRQLSAVIASVEAIDRYDVGKSLAEIALTTARSTNNADLLRKATLDVQQVREAEAAYVDVKRYFPVLADMPTDPEANLKIGRFRCFVKGDWDVGLPMLALGGDAALKALAKKEIAGVNGIKEQLTLGDGWWDVADELAGTAKNTVQDHAATWYNEALPQLSGLEKTSVEKRLAEVQATGAKPAGIGALGRPRITIVNAVYGTDKKHVEVTKKIADAVGDLGLIVSADNCIAGDTAPGERKQLTLSYTMQGQTLLQSVMEGDVLVLLSPIRTNGQGTVVLRAVYGAGCIWKNVTPMVQAAVDRKAATLKVTDESMGGDPKCEGQKFCVVVFAVDGKMGWTATRMGDQLPLPLRPQNTK